MVRTVRNFWIACAALALASVPVRTALSQPLGEVVALPNGDAVRIGGEGAGLLQAHDAGGLEATLWQLVDEGRTDDAIAVLAYVARHRGDEAAELAVMGLRIVTDLQDRSGAGVLVAAILQESGADPGAIRAAVREAGLPADFPALEPVAALEPASGFLPGDAGQPAEAGVPATVALPSDTTAADASSYGGRGGGSGGFGNGIPLGLLIGGGFGSVRDSAVVKDPPADAGVS